MALRISKERLPYLWVGLTSVLGVVSVWGLRIDIAGVLFFVIIVQSLMYILFLGEASFSTVKVYSVFSLVFFGLTPWIQHTENVTFWDGRPFSAVDFAVIGLIVVLSNLLIAISYWFFQRGKKVKMREVRICRQSDRLIRLYRRKLLGLLLAFVSTGCFVLLIWQNGFSIPQIFFRVLADDFSMLGTKPSPLELVTAKLVHLIPFFCFMYYRAELKCRGGMSRYLFFLLVVCNFPTGIPRYMVGFIYIPVLLLLVPRLRQGLRFTFMLLVALLIVFPLLSQFRYFSGAETLGALSLSLDKEFFLRGDFDAFQNLSRAVLVGPVTWGEQLLGVALFFIPRTMWDSKPVGSGYLLAEQEGYSLNNISMPWLGEGYMNFGVIGLVVFSMLLGFIMARIDRYGQFVHASKLENSYSIVIYLFLCGAFMFVLRGDLLSSVAYVMGGLFAATVPPTTYALSRLILARR